MKHGSKISIFVAALCMFTFMESADHTLPTFLAGSPVDSHEYDSDTDLMASSYDSLSSRYCTDERGSSAHRLVTTWSMRDLDVDNHRLDLEQDAHDQAAHRRKGQEHALWLNANSDDESFSDIILGSFKQQIKMGSGNQSPTDRLLYCRLYDQRDPHEPYFLRLPKDVIGRLCVLIAREKDFRKTDDNQSDIQHAWMIYAQRVNIHPENIRTVLERANLPGNTSRVRSRIQSAVKNDQDTLNIQPETVSTVFKEEHLPGSTSRVRSRIQRAVKNDQDPELAAEHELWIAAQAVSPGIASALQQLIFGSLVDVATKTSDGDNLIKAFQEKGELGLLLVLRAQEEEGKLWLPVSTLKELSSYIDAEIPKSGQSFSEEHPLAVGWRKYANAARIHSHSIKGVVDQVLFLQSQNSSKK